MLTAFDGGIGDWFGESVGISGDTIVVSAISADNGANLDQGAAYVFVKPMGGWSDMTQTAKLVAGDGAHSDWLGRSIAISGDVVVTGAEADDIGANANQGSAYIFVKPGGGGWSGTLTHTAKLTASDGLASDGFWGLCGHER
ncbi:MAG: FG-GAP repeat protein [Anaerolineae bacterium]